MPITYNNVGHKAMDKNSEHNTVLPSIPFGWHCLSTFCKETQNGKKCLQNKCITQNAGIVDEFSLYFESRMI